MEIIIIRSTAQKMKFSMEDFFSKCDQIRRKLKKSSMENFIFCAVSSEGDSRAVDEDLK